MAADDRRDSNLFTVLIRSSGLCETGGCDAPGTHLVTYRYRTGVRAEHRREHRCADHAREFAGRHTLDYPEPIRTRYGAEVEVGDRIIDTETVPERPAPVEVLEVHHRTDPDTDGFTGDVSLVVTGHDGDDWALEISVGPWERVEMAPTVAVGAEA